MRIIIIVFLLLMFGCKGEVQRERKKSEEELQIIQKDSIKDNLKYEIFVKYSNIPIAHLSNDNEEFNNYPFLIELDSLFDIYSKKKLSNSEVDNLKIMKAKRYLWTSNYDKAIKELDKLPNSAYKNLLLGISYELQGDLLSAKKYFTPLYLKINSFDYNISDCQKYLIMSVLLDKNSLEKCKRLSRVYTNLVKAGKEEIIRTHFLSTVEL